MADDDTQPVGGSIDVNRAIEIFGVQGQVQLVSSDAADTGTFFVTVYGLDVNGNPVLETVAPNGLTPVPYTLTLSQLLKALVDTPTQVGQVAVEAQIPVRENTAQGGSVTELVLDAGASAVNGTYAGLTARLLTGTGAGGISRGIEYIGATRTLTLDPPLLTAPDGSTTFRLAAGFLLPTIGASVTIEARRLMYQVYNPTLLEAQRDTFDKFFFRNDHPTDDVLLPSVTLTDPSGSLAFGLAAAVDDTLETVNRLTAPAGIVFGVAPVAVPGGLLAVGERIGVWVRMRRAPGAVQMLDSKTVLSLVSTS